MSDYRFYILDDKNHILAHQDRACADDLAALDVAKRFSGKHPVELWAGTRLVAHINRRDAEHTAAQGQSG